MRNLSLGKPTGDVFWKADDLLAAWREAMLVDQLGVAPVPLGDLDPHIWWVDAGSNSMSHPKVLTC